MFRRGLNPSSMIEAGIQLSTKKVHTTSINLFQSIYKFTIKKESSMKKIILILFLTSIFAEYTNPNGKPFTLNIKFDVQSVRAP